MGLRAEEDGPATADHDPVFSRACYEAGRRSNEEPGVAEPPKGDNLLTSGELRGFGRGVVLASRRL